MTLLLLAHIAVLMSAPGPGPAPNDALGTASFTDLAFSATQQPECREHWLTRAWTLRHAEPTRAQADLAAEVETWLTETQPGNECARYTDFGDACIMEAEGRIDWGDVARRIEQESVADEWARRAPR